MLESKKTHNVNKSLSREFLQNNFSRKHISQDFQRSLELRKEEPNLKVRVVYQNINIDMKLRINNETSEWLVKEYPFYNRLSIGLETYERT